MVVYGGDPFQFGRKTIGSTEASANDRARRDRKASEAPRQPTTTT